MRLFTAVLVLVFACGLPAWGQTRDANIDEAIAAFNHKDYATALKQFRALAAKGDANAQFDLGMMYQNGDGVTAEDKEAFGWFRKAAEQGVAQAQAQLGVMYYSGEGVGQSDAQAAAWFGKARGQGFVDPRADLEQFGQSFLLTTKTDGKPTSTRVWIDDLTGRARYVEFSELDAEHNCKFKDASVLMQFKDATLLSTLPSSGTLTIVLSMNGNKTIYDLPYGIDADSSLIFLNGPEYGKFNRYMFGVLASTKNGIGAEADRRVQELEKQSSFSFNFTTKNGSRLSLEFALDGMDAADLRKLIIATNGC
jgi:hypothetical protein